MGDIRVRAHVNDVDAGDVVDLLEMLDSEADDFSRNVRLAEPRLVSYEEAPRRVFITVQTPECLLGCCSLKIAQRCRPTLSGRFNYGLASRIA